MDALFGIQNLKYHSLQLESWEEPGYFF